MMEVTREVLGWCTVLNLGFLVFATAALVLFRGPVEAIHGRLFGLSHEELGQAYFRYLANYKVGILLFNLAPYLALVLVT